MLGSQQGVSIACQPDFMLRCDDAGVKPIAIFADGFDPHASPGDAESRLADDIRKRRAIQESGAYWVWNLSWDDLSDDSQQANLEFLQPHIVTRILTPFVQKSSDKQFPDIAKVCANPWQQLQAFLLAPESAAWAALAQQGTGLPLSLLKLIGCLS